MAKTALPRYLAEVVAVMAKRLVWGLVIFLAAVIIVAGAVAGSKYRPDRGIEITLPADNISLSPPETGVPIAEPPQKVDINRAEAWLLEALPGIGEVKAQAIIAYRQAHGPFRLTTDLLQVAGISTSVYEEIKDLITVGE